MIKKKIHRAPKKGSFLRSFAHLLPLLKGQPLGGVPPPHYPMVPASHKVKWEWPGSQRPSLLPLSSQHPLLSLAPATPTSLCFSSPPAGPLLVGTCTFVLSICCPSCTVPPLLGWSCPFQEPRPPSTTLGTSLPYFLHCATPADVLSMLSTWFARVCLPRPDGISP